MELCAFTIGRTADERVSRANVIGPLICEGNLRTHPLGGLLVLYSEIMIEIFVNSTFEPRIPEGPSFIKLNQPERCDCHRLF